MSARCVSLKISQEIDDPRCGRYLPLDGGDNVGIHRVAVCAANVGLDIATDTETLLQEETLHLPFQPRLPAPRDAGVLRRQDTRTKQRHERQRSDVAEELVRQAQVCDAADLPGHSVRAIPDGDFLHILDLFAGQDRFDHLFDIIRNGVCCFQPLVNAVRELLGVEFPTAHARIFLHESKHIAPVPLSVKAGVNRPPCEVVADILITLLHRFSLLRARFLHIGGFRLGGALKQAPPLYYLPRTPPTATRPFGVGLLRIFISRAL